jgi:hypothetical protein
MAVRDLGFAEELVELGGVDGCGGLRVHGSMLRLWGGMRSCWRHRSVERLEV